MQHLSQSQTQTKMAPKNLKILSNQCYHHITTNALFLIIPSLIFAAIHHLSIINLNHLYNDSLTAAAAILSLCISLSYFLHPRKVYLVDFACYRHDPAFSTHRDTITEKMSTLLSPESLSFVTKVMERSAAGEETFIYGARDFPPKLPFECAREEAEIVLCGAVDDLMAKTGVEAAQIGVVVVNISTFNPVPSPTTDPGGVGRGRPTPPPVRDNCLGSSIIRPPTHGSSAFRSHIRQLRLYGKQENT